MRKLFIIIICFVLSITSQAQTSPFFSNVDIEGPDAPIIQLSHQGNSIQVNLSTSPISNNYNENYHALDTSINNGYAFFDFQGYLIYQVFDSTVNHLTDYLDTTKMKLIAQSDIQDSIGSLTNHYYDTINGYCDSMLMVNASNQGLSHTFIFNQDAFTNSPFQQGNTYCFMVLSYAANTNKINIMCNNTPWTFLMGHKSSNGTGIIASCIEFNPTGVPENESLLSTINLYPNPAKDKLHFNFETSFNQVTIEIFNTTGKQILQKTRVQNNTISLNLESISSGLYFVKITTDEEQKTLKFIKQ